jgi:D-alanyl-D-alanine carboxypeptidase
VASTRADAPVAPGSRRARREAESRTRTSPRPLPGRWFARAGVLAALAGITVVIPLTQGVDSGTGTFVATAQAAEAALPSTVEALTSQPVDTAPPATMAASAAPVVRSSAAASRSFERSPLPGCDGTSRPAGANGQLATADLCTLWDGSMQLRADAASSLAEMNLAFRAKFGRDICVVDAYRTIAEQRVLKRQRGGMAAVPGKSNHGWGLAIDLCSTDTRGEVFDWIRENGAVYGWENPAWALRSGSGPFEPWHWEYTRGVQEDGEYYSS